MAAFNDYLKSLREQKALDIGTVAKRIGVHRHTQSNYEGHRDPPIDYLVDFAEVVGVPFNEILKKRLDDSKANEEAAKKAISSLNVVNSTDDKVSDNSLKYKTSSELLQVKLGELSHTAVPMDATVYIDTCNKNVAPDAMYGFLNPMTDCYFAAKLAVNETQLRLVFDNAKRKDAEFNIEGGSTESHYILKTLGLLGRVIKAELIF